MSAAGQCLSNRAKGGKAMGHIGPDAKQPNRVDERRMPLYNAATTLKHRALKLARVGFAPWRGRIGAA